ncbi:hypothetical protein PCH_Pc22g05170 [Penicillium rubens Wisconsin 54-1255]|uniref:Uncharacterized protein n=1 Tax=Penicillium rubens (strain ATCC 28089 / DSM 1075 / NRRL 1951 / Wisconsin 54-1255) TaxID=500485 RepID=B6HUD0_PENRW|nr:hypothetical protein PCH_Pc22g05170 [Penicillium rubens Wisconsin 54-1255]
MVKLVRVSILIPGVVGGPSDALILGVDRCNDVDATMAFGDHALALIPLAAYAYAILVGDSLGSIYPSPSKISPFIYSHFPKEMHVDPHCSLRAEYYSSRGVRTADLPNETRPPGLLNGAVAPSSKAAPRVRYPFSPRLRHQNGYEITGLLCLTFHHTCASSFRSLQPHQIELFPIQYSKPSLFAQLNRNNVLYFCEKHEKTPRNLPELCPRVRSGDDINMILVTLTQCGSRGRPFEARNPLLY